MQQYGLDKRAQIYIQGPFGNVTLLKYTPRRSGRDSNQQWSISMQTLTSRGYISNYSYSGSLLLKPDIGGLNRGILFILEGNLQMLLNLISCLAGTRKCVAGMQTGGLNKEGGLIMGFRCISIIRHMSHCRRHRWGLFPSA